MAGRWTGRFVYLLDMKRALVFLLVAMVVSPSPLWAQTPQTAQPAAPETTSSPAVDPAKMGVSLERIKRELAQAEAAAAAPDGNPLKFSFTVEVVGQAPRINFLEGFSVTGAVPYGSPTHREVLDVLTPKEFRSPVIPFSAMAFWAAQQLWQKSKKTRCEEELAEYKRAVMAGIAIAAPRCTQ